MATYAIGDVQGCYAELQSLLDRIAFDPSSDRLWFTGDLVNRGPDSLRVLRQVKALGDAAVTVLGNHDLHLIAVAEGTAAQRRRDTLDAILQAPDAGELVSWLRHRPLLHRDAAAGVTLVHAGIPPCWDLRLAAQCAAELADALRGDDYRDFVLGMYGDTPARWHAKLSGRKRLRFMVNAFTRMRYVFPDGRLEFREKGPPGSQAPPLVPWFAAPRRRSRGEALIFGHWSTLRLSDREQREFGVYPMDTGCVWGGELTALRLEDRRVIRVAAQSSAVVPARSSTTKL